MAKPPKTKQTRGEKKLIRDLLEIKIRAQLSGFSKTARALDKALQEIGWEIAEQTKSKKEKE